MKRFQVSALAALLVSWGTCHAQDDVQKGLQSLGNMGAMTQMVSGMFGIDMNAGGLDKMILLNQEPVQKELKLTEKQIKQAKEKWDDQQQQMRSVFQTAMMNPDDAAATIGRLGKANDNALSTVLKSGQIKRLKEISLQQRGAQAFADPEVQQQLSLTAAQRKQVKEILDKSRGTMRETMNKMMGSGTMPMPGMPGGQAAGAGGQQFSGQPGFGGPSGFGVQPGFGGQPGLNAPQQFGGPSQFGPQGAVDPSIAVNNAGAAPGQPTDPKAQQDERNKQMSAVGTMVSSTQGELEALLTKSQLTKWEKMKGAPFEMQIGGLNRALGVQPDANGNNNAGNNNAGNNGFGASPFGNNNAGDVAENDHEEMGDHHIDADHGNAIEHDDEVEMDGAPVGSADSDDVADLDD